VVQGRRKTPLKFQCIVCGGESYTRATRTPKFCGNSCRERARYERHRDKRIEAARRYREKNHEEVKRRNRERYRSNWDHFRELNRKSYLRHRDRRISEALEWQKNNPDRVSVRHAKRRSREAGYEISTSFHRKMLHRYGGKCAYCKVVLDVSDRKTPTGLHWDHVLPLSKGGKNSEGNLLPACSSCNLRKGARYLVDFKYKVREDCEG